MATRKQPTNQLIHSREELLPEFSQDSVGQPDPVREILKIRGDIYGSFQDNAVIAQDLKAILAEGASYSQLSSTTKEFLDMTASKLARIVNGQYHSDNFVDIAGYATLVVDAHGSN